MTDGPSGHVTRSAAIEIAWTDGAQPWKRCTEIQIKTRPSKTDNNSISSQLKLFLVAPDYSLFIRQYAFFKLWVSNGIFYGEELKYWVSNRLFYYFLRYCTKD